MIFDLDMYRGPTQFGERSVVVIGSGPVGLALAAGLRRAGIDVVVMESGSRHATSHSPFNDATYGGEAFTGVAGRGRGLGGGSALWAGQCMRFNAADFAHRDWVPGSGWPISYDDMLPFYAEAEDFLEVSSDGYFSRVWGSFGVDAIDVEDEELTHHFSVYCPHPDLGARDLNKLRTDPGLTLLLNATATEFLRVDDRITGVRGQSLTGTNIEIQAGTFVLCVGAIECARLLLLPSPSFPSGIGNEHTGRHFQDHPNGVLGHLAPGSGHRDPSGLVDAFSLFYRSGLRYLPKVSLTLEAQQQCSVLNAGAVFAYEWPLDSMSERLRQVQRAVSGKRYDLSTRAAVQNMVGNPAALGRVLKRRFQGKSPGGTPERVALHVFLEQDPNTSSQVTLSSRRDPFGMPLAEVKWVLSDTERRAALALANGVDRFLERRGLDRLAISDQVADGLPGWAGLLGDNQHHAGTARMAASAGAGVVDKDSRVFGLDNLYVAGGAVFPTASYANPTLTMVAQAFRLAGHLRAQSRLTRRPAGHVDLRHSRKAVARVVSRARL